MKPRQIDYDTARRLVSKTVLSINTFYIGVIVGYNHLLERYDIQPLVSLSSMDGKTNIPKAIVLRAPSAFSKTGSFAIRNPYKVNDLVYVGCCKDTIDEVLASHKIENVSGKYSSFREIDSIILGGIMGDKEVSLPETNLNDFIIVNRTNGDKIVMLESGGINIVTTGNVDVTAGGNATVSSSATTINSKTTINGNLSVNGSISATSNIASGGNVTDGEGKTLGSHTHKYFSGRDTMEFTGGAE